jgi:3',5'-nucleoside bisphosphate phosphatase
MRMTAVDLHTHSTASDGSTPPADLVRLASGKGLTAIALTDHDTQQGLPAATAMGLDLGLEVIPGTELSLEFDEGAMHLVVLWLEPGTGPLQDRLRALQAGRGGRNRRIVEILTGLGMPVDIQEVEEEAGGGSVGRPHIAAVMMRKGYVTTIAEAFDLWLGSSGPAYVGRPRLTPEEGIGLARDSGAIPVLAHPHTLGITRSKVMAELLDRLAAAGLIGLEAHCAGYRRHERDGYADLARRFGLIPSGGSDYHGSYKPGLQIGTGYGDLFVNESVLDELRPHAVLA